jgi:hypothetical protein
MARKHYANAIISHQNVPFDEWMEVLRSQNEGAVPRDHVHRIAKTVLRKCDPKQYLLSHATIVASVDTFAPKGAKTGRFMNRGVQVDVRYPDYRIKPQGLGIINNNGDVWERSLLLSTYRTFIGAPNYCEHVQIPELSKGFIVDAVARDLGHSCYIDILVATDRKHTQLVQDILSGDMNAMSMGCISMFTVCTKCGNVAADDSQLCPCIQYEGKHTEFVDESGQKQKIAELIGHVSVPNSNQFIEASWVKNPAFAGAVRRNFLNKDMIKLSAKIDEAKTVYEIRKDISEPVGMKKAAGTLRKADQDPADPPSDIMDMLSGGGQGESPDQGSPAPDSEPGQQGEEQEAAKSDAAAASDKIDGLLDKVQEQLLTIIVEKLGDKLKPKMEDVGTVKPAPDLLEGNDNVIRSSNDFGRLVRKRFASTPKLVNWAERTYKIVHEGGIKSIRAASLQPRDLIVLSWIIDSVRGRRYASDLYHLAMHVGPLSNYPSEKSFLTACSLNFGRALNTREKEFLVWKGKIASVGRL